MSMEDVVENKRHERQSKRKLPQGTRMSAEINNPCIKVIVTCYFRLSLFITTLCRTTEYSVSVVGLPPVNNTRYSVIPV